jgi:hypothetical protein
LDNLKGPKSAETSDPEAVLVESTTPERGKLAVPWEQNQKEDR